MPTKDPNAPVLRSSSKNQSSMEKIDEINQSFKERDVKGDAQVKGLSYIDLKAAPLNQDALQLTTWEEVQAAGAVPFDLSGNELSIACVDANHQGCKDMVKAFEDKGYKIMPFLCSKEGLDSTQHYYDNFGHFEEVPLETSTQEGEALVGKENLFSEEKEIFATATGPEMANHMNLMAIRFRASDVHFQPMDGRVSLRMRRDGQLYQIFMITHKQYNLLNGDLKRSAGMKANVKNIPQDGNYNYVANERKISVRVSSLPSKHGESLVLRILDAKNAIVKLEQLGFSEISQKKIGQHLEKQRGLILVTGPTGSGKTSTLYSCLNAVNKPDNKIITLEDPVEFELENTVQSEINEEENYSFALGLRAILRQDPDIVMVGEIRDKEAAEIALQASLTGHLVLSTVHSNDAIATIPRLLNMGLKPYILAAGLELIVAQRLVRRLCEHCKESASPDQKVMEEIDQTIEQLKQRGVKIESKNILTAKGCEKCAGTGYEGRIAIAETLSISDSIRRLMLAGESINSILQAAQQEGFLSLKEDGILKVVNGQTTIEEIWKGLV
jgi:type IV pilus assembly protein PilB